MNSLRRRLTIAYTVLVTLLLAFVALALTYGALDAVIRPVNDAVAAAASAGRALAVERPPLMAAEVVLRLRAIVGHREVGVFARPPLPSPHVPGLAPGGFGPPPRAFGGPAFGLAAWLGVHPEFVRVRDAEIGIFPDAARIDGTVRTYLTTLVAVLALSVAAGWLIARWLAAQAVAPLIAVTTELRRFASGDFAPNPVPFGGLSDIAALIEAYNGAAAQVGSAFAERARAEDRMRRFMADAGHELRTPLSVVSAYLDVLRKGGAAEPAVLARALRALTAEAARMRRLVDRLVLLARLEQPETTQPIVVDLGDLARDAVASVAAARDGDVQCDVESGTLVLADPADLHEAIANLVDNALKYGEGSAVRVRVEHEREAVLLRVSDGGPGIVPEERERIFERFYRGVAQRATEGSGLGLAIVARAAARAGGELRLERTGQRDTTFALRLPLVRA